MEKYIIKKLQWCLSFWIQNVICLKKITTPLENIKFKMWYFLKKLIFFFLILTNIFFYKPGCMISKRSKKDQRNIKKKKIFQTGKT
jgi:hypothetical protein